MLERLRQRLGGLRASREDLAAQDEEVSAIRRGTVPIGELLPRRRARASDKPVLVGQLFDGTGSVDLVWIGRRQIAGVRPGIHLAAEGMVAAGRTRPNMYDPSYEILGPDA